MRHEIDVRQARTDDEVERALGLRHRVFCDEQGVDPAAEQDGRDADAVHLVAFRGDSLVGTCRLLLEGRTVRLGRAAVASEDRGAGIGTALLEAADWVSLDADADRIRLHAQTSARSLYERSGYVSRGEPFLEEGIEHVTMEKRLA